MPGAAVFLDRDGVINRASVRDGIPRPPEGLSDLEILPGVEHALHQLKKAGFALIVVTNQPDVARGRQSVETVRSIHDRLGAALPIDEFRVCWHDDNDACDCRKPRPGLITRPPHYDVTRSVMVGDRWRDVDAGRNAGCHAVVFVDNGYDEKLRAAPDVVVRSLAEAADWILAKVTT